MTDVILHNAESPDEWSCCWAACQSWTTGAEGIGLYGRTQFLTWEYEGKAGGEWRIDVWRDSAGIHCKVTHSVPEDR